MKLISRNIRPRDIVTRLFTQKAGKKVDRLGETTKAVPELSAIAKGTGIDFDLSGMTGILQGVPSLAVLESGGRYVAKDMGDSGGMTVVTGALPHGGHVHGACHPVAAGKPDETTMIIIASLAGLGAEGPADVQTGGRPVRAARKVSIGHVGPGATVGGQSRQVTGSGTASMGTRANSGPGISGRDMGRREMASCFAAFRRAERAYRVSVLRKSAQEVGSARLGAVTTPGARQEIVCYADE